jgi:copper chaperone CopZ
MLALVGALFMALAGFQEPAAPREDLSPITLHVAGISCPACAAPVCAAVARVPGVKDAGVSVDEKFLRLSFDARKTPVQALMKALLGNDERFPSRLVLQLENGKSESEALEKARAAVAAVPGVRAMSLPDKEGIVLVTFRLEERTLLADLLGAAKGAGVPLRDPAAKK